MYFLRRSWGRGSTKHLVPSLQLLHLHGDIRGVVLPVVVDHKLGQHLILQLQWFSFIWGRGTCNKMKVMQVVHLGCARGREREEVREGEEGEGREREEGREGGGERGRREREGGRGRERGGGGEREGGRKT